MPNVAKGEVVMGTGAAGVVDALGFKEARRRPGALEGLIESVRATRRAVEAAASTNAMFAGAETQVAAFSDSIILATPTKQQPHDWRGDVTLASAVDHVAMAASALARPGTPEAPPLLYRGCIAAGSLLVTEGIYIGDAIDDAAELYEQANAAIVWLAPSAAAAIPSGSQLLYQDWRVPLKGRGDVETKAVNPFYDSCNQDVWADDLEARLNALEGAMLAAFMGPTKIDVVQKQQNTRAFLAAAKQHSLDAVPEIQEQMAQDQQDERDDD